MSTRILNDISFIKIALSYLYMISLWAFSLCLMFDILQRILFLHKVVSVVTSTKLPFLIILLGSEMHYVSISYFTANAQSMVKGS